MRAILLIICTTLLSFSAKEKDDAVFGVWKGAYGMGTNVEQTWVYLGAHNSMKFYGGYLKPENSMTGTYTLQGDTAIIFVCKNKKTKQQIKMKGNFNRTKSFVDGVWESNDDHYGSFYLQKQKTK
jgi:hypothetical protein